MIMQKWQIILLGLVLFGVIVIGTSILKDTREKDELQLEIDSAINEYREKHEIYISFAEIELFPWDRMYIFGPYSICENIIETLNSPLFGAKCELSGIESYENRSLFVFLKSGSIIRYTVFNGITVDRNNQDGYPRENAHFKIDEQGKMIWLGNE